MNDKMAELLEKLATKLGVAADALWTALLRQAKVEAIFDVAIISGIFYAAYKILKSEMLKELKEEGDNIGHGIACGLTFGISFLFIALVGQDLITCLFNPEYFALHKILKF